MPMADRRALARAFRGATIVSCTDGGRLTGVLPILEVHVGVVQNWRAADDNDDGGNGRWRRQAWRRRGASMAVADDEARTGGPVW